ncbi:hypothetical protein [Nonomuraea sp. C10]|uniref:hypothetical protein n=1 Tax=Nonomuraea sp. C10 TaxID=2600577 RepID=UPI0011CEB803|nr:hypothetical protein [Nonomuraea sp. C10]TXK40461.1 hypothetical protein FR742_13395 [Nonomuraea sp. C10]
MDLDEVAGRLYALPPSDFTAARTAEARAAKEAGDAALAREIGKLRKPTVSAWAVNRAAREHADELGELLAVGEELRAAWAAQDSDALAAATRRRGEVTGRLSRLIREVADLSAAAAAEVDQTLDAAVVDADAADEVRRGRLAKPLSYSGFAPAPVSAAPAARRKKPPPPEDEARKAKERAEAEAREAKERTEAEAAHREWSETLAEAEREHGERADKVARLEKRLAKARKRLEAAAHRLDVARREERHARARLNG